MKNTNDLRDSSSRSTFIAPRWPVALGFILGLFQFATGLGSLSLMNKEESWLNVSLLVAMSFVLLPLAIVGIFHPRIAAFATFILAFLIACGYVAALGLSTIQRDGFLLTLRFVVKSLVPPLLAGLLFLYSARQLNQRVTDIID